MMNAISNHGVWSQVCIHLSVNLAQRSHGVYFFYEQKHVRSQTNDTFASGVITSFLYYALLVVSSNSNMNSKDANPSIESTRNSIPRVSNRQK